MINIPINGSPFKKAKWFEAIGSKQEGHILKTDMSMNDTNMGAPLVDRSFKGATVEPSA